MLALRHCHWHTSVQVSGPESIIGVTTCVSTGKECSASLLVNKKSFSIEKARWEIYRGPDGPVSMDIEGLKGVEAYMGSGAALRSALSGCSAAEALPLMTETVRGIIQAETFLFRERGFKDSQSYDEYWNSMYAGSCRYYSNLDRVTTRWEDYIAGQERFGSLYNKFKTVSVSRDGGALHAAASMSDSFHEVGIDARLDLKTGVLTEARCRLLRGPDQVCCEAAEFSSNLLGKCIASLSKKEMAAALAGGSGCVHIIDTWNDLALVLGEILRETDF
ncbi:MAG: hypothetical protein JL50_05785 [Peptococcaceae bacterium BICA1-7]|nr:MAG: hypothetical protein JL50_05785 [Peptococcaceae bacterium BICA1-7]HBV96121.1 DUF2889 domain-containing protein [Desulfotomaculum sp.]